MQKRRLEGKVIVISGGTKGVGRTMAEEFGKAGAKVVIGGRDSAAGEQAVQMIESCQGDAIFVQTDVRNVKDCKKIFDEAYKKWLNHKFYVMADS